MGPCGLSICALESQRAGSGNRNLGRNSKGATRAACAGGVDEDNYGVAAVETIRVPFLLLGWS
jgi:hypothetical protein